MGQYLKTTDEQATTVQQILRTQQQILAELTLQLLCLKGF